MIFSSWTENRATEDAGRTSASPSHHSISIHSISRQSSAVMPVPAAQLENLERDDLSADIKIEKLEADETQTDVSFDDKRPADFKSTFWEVCAIAALVSCQLCNVYNKIIVLIVGIGTRATNCYSDLDSALPLDHRAAGLGQCCYGNSCRFVLVGVWEVGRLIWSETCAPGGSDDARRWWCHLRC
jgi:hypothetical protein